MVFEITTLDVNSGLIQAFEKALPQALEIITTAPGYIQHTVKRHVENRSRYILLVIWERREDSEANFRGTTQHKKLKSMLHRYYELYPETEYYEAVEGYSNVLRFESTKHHKQDSQNKESS